MIKLAEDKIATIKQEIEYEIYKCYKQPALLFLDNESYHLLMVDCMKELSFYVFSKDPIAHYYYMGMTIYNVNTNDHLVVVK